MRKEEIEAIGNMQILFEEIKSPDFAKNHSKDEAIVNDENFQIMHMKIDYIKQILEMDDIKSYCKNPNLKFKLFKNVLDNINELFLERNWSYVGRCVINFTRIDELQTKIIDIFNIDKVTEPNFENLVINLIKDLSHSQKIEMIEKLETIYNVNYNSLSIFNIIARYEMCALSLMVELLNDSKKNISNKEINDTLIDKVFNYHISNIYTRSVSAKNYYSIYDDFLHINIKRMTNDDILLINKKFKKVYGKYLFYNKDIIETFLICEDNNKIKINTVFLNSKNNKLEINLLGNLPDYLNKIGIKLKCFELEDGVSYGIKVLAKKCNAYYIFEDPNKTDEQIKLERDVIYEVLLEELINKLYNKDGVYINKDGWKNIEIRDIMETIEKNIREMNLFTQLKEIDNNIIKEKEDMKKNKI